MTGWKKAVLQAAVFGAAFAVVLCLIVGAWTWYFRAPLMEQYSNSSHL
jgi:hypothetical protein